MHSSYYLPSMTGIATLVLDEQGRRHRPSRSRAAPRADGAAAQGDRGADGTYPFDIARSVKGYRINKFLHDMVDPEHRARFLDEPETAFKAAGLTEEEQDLIRNRDWPGMIRYGVIFFMLEKLAAVSGVSNLHVYAAMRGETLEDFLQDPQHPGHLLGRGERRGQEPRLARARHPLRNQRAGCAAPRSVQCKRL